MILVCCDCCEDGLREDVRAILFSLEVGDGTSVLPPLDEMDSRLIPVHGVQHDLKPRMAKANDPVGLYRLHLDEAQITGGHK